MINVRHVFANLLGSALPILVVLISVPLYLHAIGTEKYGVLSLVWIVFGYFGVFDLGVSRAVTRAISRVRDDTAGKAQLIWSAVAFNFVAGAAVAVLSATAFLILSDHLGTAEFVSELFLSMPLMMLGIPVLTVTSTLNGALDGEERFKTANAIQVTGTALYQLAPLGTAYLVSTALHDLINSVILARLVVLALYAVAADRAFDLLRRRSMRMAVMRDLVRFGSTVAIINIIDPVFTRVDQIVVAHFSGTQGVAAYNIAVNSIGRLGILPMAMSRALFPRLSAGNEDDHKIELHAMKGRVVPAWTAICAAAMLASDILFRLWLHNAIAAHVSDIAKVFAVGLWANCLAILPYTALQASGRSSAIIKAHLIEMPLYVIVLVWLTYSLGPLGSAAAWGLRSFADYVILWKMCEFPVRRQIPFAGLFIALSAFACLLLPQVRPFFLGG